MLTLLFFFRVVIEVNPFFHVFRVFIFFTLLR